MVALSFQKRFAELVENGAKTQTVRAPRKRIVIRPGTSLQLYTGMRTKACRKLGDAVCTDVRNIEVRLTGIYLGLASGVLQHNPFPEGAYGDNSAARQFARADGFANASALIDFFLETHGLPFTGQAIFWRKL